MTKIPRVSREVVDALKQARLADIDAGAFEREQPHLIELAEYSVGSQLPRFVSLEERALLAGIVRGAMHLCWLAIAKQMEKGQ